MTKITLAVVAILFAFTTKAQTYCVTPPPPNNLVVQDSNYRTQIQPPTCGDLSGFITPNNPLTFRVNFHFFRPTTGNPYYNTAYDYYKNVTSDDCDTLIKIINQRMAVFNAPDKPVSGVTSRTNSYVKYQIAKDSFLFHSNWVYLPHVLFHTNDTAWSPGYGTSDYLYNRYKVNPATEINIFFTADLTNPGSGAGLAGHVMISALPWVPTGWRTFNHILDMQLLLHELGHSAGLLCHTDRSFIPLNTPANIFPLNINTDYFVESDCGCDGSTSPCTPSPNPCTTWGNVSSVSQGGVSSNNIMGYNNDRHYLSPNQIGSFFYGARAGVTSKYVVNYTGNQCQYDSSKTINIRNDTTWSSAVIVNGDVVIQPGKTLTIHCTAYFSQHSRVLVMPAAKLVIDGGILTALCDSTWSGVQVWGNSTKSQAMSLNIHTQTVRAVYQGYVSIINGGTIQNAQVGITTIAKYNNGNTDWNKTGGIIEGTSANFIGNTKDVEFMYYQADVSASTFANCNFNQNGLKLSDSWPDARVSLYGIKGVTFYGNTFSALGGLTPTSPHFNLIDNGITSIDASYTINDNNATHNTFKAFKYGINAQNTAIFNPITVNNTTFNQCFTGGVYLNAMHYSTITNCTFNIWPALGTLSVPVYGVYLDASHGYSVRGNKLNGSTINSYIHTGIIVNNSGTGSNSIY
ncbi:MAG TPA: hypothetical protein VK835_10300, partial [Bacteroidia bacterium]|nr:hypothetical protein [Bacteroidia bacterium]